MNIEILEGVDKNLLNVNIDEYIDNKSSDKDTVMFLKWYRWFINHSSIIKVIFNLELIKTSIQKTDDNKFMQVVLTSGCGYTQDYCVYLNDIPDNNMKYSENGLSNIISEVILNS